MELTVESTALINDYDRVVLVSFINNAQSGQGVELVGRYPLNIVALEIRNIINEDASNNIFLSIDSITTINADYGIKNVYRLNFTKNAAKYTFEIHYESSIAGVGLKMISQEHLN